MTWKFNAPFCRKNCPCILWKTRIIYLWTSQLYTIQNNAWLLQVVGVDKSQLNTCPLTKRKDKWISVKIVIWLCARMNDFLFTMSASCDFLVKMILYKLRVCNQFLYQSPCPSQSFKSQQHENKNRSTSLDISVNTHTPITPNTNTWIYYITTGITHSLSFQSRTKENLLLSPLAWNWTA